jgi:hypothetical protein
VHASSRTPDKEMSEHAPEPEKPSDSGVLAGNQLVSSGQVVKHETFGNKAPMIARARLLQNPRQGDETDLR